MLRIRIQRPQRLLSVSVDGNQWWLDDQILQPCGKTLVVWRWLLIIPLHDGRHRQWLWLWWFQLSGRELAQLRAITALHRGQPTWN